MTENELKVLRIICDFFLVDRPTPINFSGFSKYTGLSKEDLDDALIGLNNKRYITELVLNNEDSLLKLHQKGLDAAQGAEG